jgi:PII-like signaling protein
VRIEGQAKLVRIYIGETDRWHGQPLYMAILLKAREMGLAGGTVFRGIAGYGANSVIHTANILRLSEDLPVVIEIVDTDEKIQAFLPVLDEMVKEGLILHARGGGHQVRGEQMTPSLVSCGFLFYKLSRSESSKMSQGTILVASELRIGFSRAMYCSTSCG